VSKLARLSTIIACVILWGALSAVPTFAGERVVSINSGSGNAVWFISGEPSLVMNGFDMNLLGVALPAVMDAVTINVNSPVAAPVELVVYQDANGGSPVDATLSYRTTTTIGTTGSVRIVLPQPVTITQRGVWVGFYLPVDFRFTADTSGSSALTYWAWTPGGTFDLSNLASAAVLGPADGSAPVNINMNGKARISFEVYPSTSGGTIPQTVGAGDANLALMQSYPVCANLLWDTQDETVSLRDAVNLHCQIRPGFESPTTPLGYSRRGDLYDIVIFKSGGVVAAQRLDIAVTHCIRPAAEDLATAVIGNGFGVPRTWRILPTQRFGDLICAEVRYGGLISYFVPIS